MKNKFIGYYKLSEDQFQKIWKECVFVFDACALLNLYGYSSSTRDEYLSALEGVSERVWLPYQFALEYQKNRHKAIMEQVKNYARVEGQLKQIYEQEFSPKTKHPHISKRDLNSFARIRSNLEAGRKVHEALLSDDPYFERITKIFKQSVGEPPLEEELTRLYQQADSRYKQQRPPGFADLQEKGLPDAYGDYIGWYQMLQHGKKLDKPMIFVTDDAKEDWWRIVEKKTVGPRPELVAEFQHECNREFYMYSSDRFVKYANQYLSQSVSREAIQEIAAYMEIHVSSQALKPLKDELIDLKSATGQTIDEPAKPSEAELTKTLQATSGAEMLKELQG